MRFDVFDPLVPAVDAIRSEIEDLVTPNNVNSTKINKMNRNSSLREFRFILVHLQIDGQLIEIEDSVGHGGPLFIIIPENPVLQSTPSLL